MGKHFIVGAFLGLLTLVLLAVMVNFTLGLTLNADGAGTFSTMNALGIILAYGVAMAIIGSLADRFFSTKKKRK